MGRVRAAIIAISSLSPGGALPPSPPPTSTHSSTHHQVRDTQTCCAFVDRRKPFDTSSVDATLAQLHGIGITGGMWRTMANFLFGTLSQIRIDGGHSALWIDSGIVQRGFSLHCCSASQ